MADIATTVIENAGKSFEVLGNIAVVTFWGLLALGAVYIFIYFMKFKHPIYLFKEEGKGIRLYKDRGQKDKKKQKFTALKNKDIDFPYPESKFEFSQGKQSILCAMVKNQSASWLSITDNPSFVPANYDMQNKMINDFNSTWNIIKPKENFWDKYGQQILWIGSLGIFLVIIILILKRMDKIIAMGNSVALAQAAAGKQVINSLPFIFWGVSKKK